MTSPRSEIAKQLGLTPSGLKVLVRAAQFAAPRRRLSQVTAGELRSLNFLDECNNVTRSGRRVVERARELGW